MKTYSSILDLEKEDIISDDLKELLALVEKVNPCQQEYLVTNKSFLVSYKHKLNLFNFLGKVKFYKELRIIGLPISLCKSAYYEEVKDIEKLIASMKGLKLVLNGRGDLANSNLTLSTFIFKNDFISFDDYMSSLRSSYRRRLKAALDKGHSLSFEKIKNADFTEEHYGYYKSVVQRSDNPLETLPIDFFQQYESEIYEIRHRTTRALMGFIQLKEIDSVLYFLFCGFEREDYNKYDIYYNILLKIIQVGIEMNVDYIDFGQTSEESKLKIGCREEYRYLNIYHSNGLVNKFLQILLPIFSYKPSKTIYRVFKEND